MFTSIVLSQRKRKNKVDLEKWFNPKKRNLGICPSAHYADGYVDDKKKYRKIIPCGREDCSSCGQDGSLLHRQRFIRGLFKIMACETMGYFVFTFPMEIRQKLLNAYVLDRLSKYVKDLLRSYSWCLGLVMRWHWGGDRSHCWHPHLNVLLNFHGEGWLPLRILESIRKNIVSWINKELNENIPDIVMEYHYTRNKGKMVHWWRYVCRSTMLLTGNDLQTLNIRWELRGFRNIRWAGHWDTIPDLSEKNLIYGGDDVVWVFHSWFDPITQEETYSEWEYIGYGVFRIVNTGTDPPLNKHKTALKSIGKNDKKIGDLKK